MLVLGIETSCDETGVALYHTEQGLLAHQLYSQVKLHSAYGGVVPELAARDHVQKLLPLVQLALSEAKICLNDINGIAYTAGPGLIGALLVGAMFGRSLAWSLGVPAVAVNHMEAHLLVNLLQSPKPTFPFLTLLISGGHTQLVVVRALGDYTILGETVDDAVGEAFDKSAKLLGLGYPGGAALAQVAGKGRAGKIQFTRPMLNRPGLDFSFSGLKTAVVNAWRASTQTEQDKADIAYAFEQAAVSTLVIKCKRAIQQTGIKQLVIAGGVAANQQLRQSLAALAEDLSISLFFPPLEWCTDNGVMVAFTGALYLQAGKRANLSVLVKPRWRLGEDY